MPLRHPRQSLGVSENRDIAGGDQVEEEVFELRRRGVVRRLDQHIAGIGQRNEPSGAQSGHEIRAHMHVRPGDETERDRLGVEPLLQRRHRLPDTRAVIMIKARQNVRRARHGLDALSDRRPGHRKRHANVARPVVEARQHVTVQIDHS